MDEGVPPTFTEILAAGEERDLKYAQLRSYGLINSWSGQTGSPVPMFGGRPVYDNTVEQDVGREIDRALDEFEYDESDDGAEPDPLVWTLVNIGGKARKHQLKIKRLSKVRRGEPVGVNAFYPDEIEEEEEEEVPQTINEPKAPIGPPVRRVYLGPFGTNTRPPLKKNRYKPHRQIRAEPAVNHVNVNHDEYAQLEKANNDHAGSASISAKMPATGVAQNMLNEILRLISTHSPEDAETEEEEAKRTRSTLPSSFKPPISAPPLGWTTPPRGPTPSPLSSPCADADVGMDADVTAEAQTNFDLEKPDDGKGGQNLTSTGSSDAEKSTKPKRKSEEQDDAGDSDKEASKHPRVNEEVERAETDFPEPTSTAGTGDTAAGRTSKGKNAAQGSANGTFSQPQPPRGAIRRFHNAATGEMVPAPAIPRLHTQPPGPSRQN